MHTSLHSRYREAGFWGEAWALGGGATAPSGTCTQTAAGRAPVVRLGPHQPFSALRLYDDLTSVTL